MSISAIFPGLSDNPDAKLEDYLFFFTNYEKNYWEEHGGDGSFEFKSEQGNVILFFFECFGQGISLRYDFNIPDIKSGTCWYSIGDKNSITNLIDVNEGLFIPQGSCLSPELALSVIGDFFKNPLEKSLKVEWINADDIDWSSVY
ncbi:TPA: hypothetical protein J1004_004373 [Escherichia coli]|uniref:hypothetical protein n=1 Tax=Escherichia coli TaxID=562 RepID=UPI001B005553|nr:hypothetical protein [Escherichia coli]MDX5672339.1 hypothetical protein [Escherichia coli]HBA7973796.1 hypothetical protein [Escherichia coli]